MKIKKFQEGGQLDPAAQQAPAGAPAGQGGPEEQIVQMATEIVQQLGPEAAIMLSEAIVAIVQQTSQPQQAPTYAKKGGKLVKVN